MNTVYIQAQDQQGTWRTYSVTMADPIVVLQSMQSLKTRFPEYRVRAIDGLGRLYDILG